MGDPNVNPKKAADTIGITPKIHRRLRVVSPEARPDDAPKIRRKVVTGIEAAAANQPAEINRGSRPSFELSVTCSELVASDGLGVITVAVLARLRLKSNSHGSITLEQFNNRVMAGSGSFYDCGILVVP